MSKKQQWEWRNRGSKQPWEKIDKPEFFWLQMEYRRSPQQ